MFSTIIQRRHHFLLALFIILAFATFSYFAVMRHFSLSSYYFDLGIIHQTVHNTAFGRFFELNDPNTYQQTNRLGLHFDPIMAVLAPFYWIWSNAAVLVIGQAFVLVMGAIPLYLLALRILKEKTPALLISLSYLLYYPMQWTSLFDFHTVTFGTTLLLWAFYLAESGRYRWSWVAIAGLWLVKENVPIITFMMGCYFLIMKRNDKQACRFGGLLALVSTMVFILLWFIIMPFLEKGEHFASAYYTTDIMSNVQRIFSPATWKYVSGMLMPVGFLSLLSPVHLAVAASEWAIVILSKNENMRNINYHYTAMITPFVFISAVYGVRNLTILLKLFLRKMGPKRIKPKNVILSASVLILLLSAYTSFTRGPFPQANFTINHQRLAVIADWQERLKDDTIPVAATGHLAPHFSNRENFYNFFFDFAYGYQGMTDEDIEQSASHYEDAEYVLVLESEVENDHYMVQYYYNHLLQNPLFEKVFDSEGIQVYKNVPF